MALTEQILRENAALAGLTAEQFAAITEMSRNDEAAVIGNRISEIYGGLDTDIFNASGVAKGSTEKTYDYAKRVIGEMKTQAASVETLKTQVADLEKEKTRLEGIVARGTGDAETKRQLAQAKADLDSVTQQYTELKASFDTEKAAHEKALFDVKIDNEMARATAGIKFKATFPEAVTSVLLRQAIDKVKGMNPQYIDDGNGGQVLAFSENNAILRNPDTNLKPFTAAELITKQLSSMGVLESVRVQTGTGAQQTQQTPQVSGDVVELSAARTQVEASEILKKALIAQGFARGTKEYQDRYDKAWKENNIQKLPMQ